MNRSFRKLLLFVSFAFFLGIAPLMVFYAMGYRLSDTENYTTPVGVVLLDTNPRRAQIYIDGQRYGTTPRSISNLPPGQINLLISKDGYQNWQKKVAIIPGLITELRSVRLFPQNPDRTPLASRVTAYSVSPNRKLIALVDNEQKLSIIDEQGIIIQPAMKSNLPIKDLLWSPDSNYILVMGTKGSSILDLTSAQPTLQRIPELNGASDVTWDQRVPGRLFYINQHQLIAHHLPSQTTQTLASQAETFAISGNAIYLVVDPQTIALLNLQGHQTDRLFFESSSGINKLLVTPGSKLAIRFQDNSLAWYNNDVLEPIATEVISAGWSPDERLIYYQTDTMSLHVYNAFDERLPSLPLQESRLVLRLSRSITDPQWFAGGRHIIYQVDDEIIITEIDPGGNPVSYSVDTTNLGRSHPAVGSEGSRIYYLKNISGTTILVKTSLIVPGESFFSFALR